jgi:hypothetical protein
MHGVTPNFLWWVSYMFQTSWTIIKELQVFGKQACEGTIGYYMYQQTTDASKNMIY